MNQVGGRAVTLKEGGLASPSTEGLQAEGTRAGEEIDGMGPLGGDPHEIEDRLPHPVFHRPDGEIAAVGQLSAAETPADDPQPDRPPIP